MAGFSGRKARKFLSPADFQTNIGIGTDNKSVKLLPPTEYEILAKEADGQHIETDETRRQAELDLLRDENKRLKQQLEKAREEELELQEQYRRNKALLQRTKVDDALDFKRMAETQEENMALQAEGRKQSAVVKKLKTELKHMKSVSERDIAQLEKEISKHSALHKQLRHEMKEKETRFEAELEEFEERCKKQSFTIKDLKLQVQRSQEQIQEDRKGFEDVISKNEYQRYEEVKKLEHCLKKSEDKFSKELEWLKGELVGKEKLVEEMGKEANLKTEELENLKGEIEARESEFIRKTQECQEHLLARQALFDQRTAEMEKDLNEKATSHQYAMDKLKRKLQKAEEELHLHVTEVSQLKAYIGENLPDSQLERLKQENTDLRSDSKALRHENTSLKTTVDLLNIRLSSISEILTIQDAELKKSLKSPASDIQEDNLVTLWRQKVFALLVQLKSQEISQEHEKNLERTQVKSLSQQLSEAHKEVAVLSHSLADRSAELQIETNKVRCLELELEEGNITMEKQAAQLTRQESAIQSVRQVLGTTESWMKTFGAAMEEALAKLASCSQRVNFASGRVRFLQGLFTRREAQWKQELAEATSSQMADTDNTHGSCADEAENPLCHAQLSNEVERLMRERDLLMSQIQQDATKLEERVTIVKEEYETQLCDAKAQIDQLHSALQEERERSAALREKSEAAEENLNESESTIETLKADLAKHEGMAAKALDKALSEEHARFTEELANMEGRLNDVRREHTKAVVALRQAERQVAREQEKAAAQLAQEKTEHEAALEKLQTQLVDLEREKNLLRATVRQESLKVPRHPPARRYQSSSDDSEKDGEKENRYHQQKGKYKHGKTAARKTHTRKPQAPCREHLSAFSHSPTGPRFGGEGTDPSNPLDVNTMTSVLKDLQSLSTALLTKGSELPGQAQQPTERSEVQVAGYRDEGAAATQP